MPEAADEADAEWYGPGSKAGGRRDFLSMLENDSITRLIRAEDGTELGEEVRNQTDETRVKLRGSGEDDLL